MNEESLRDLFDRAIELKPHEQAAFLDRACAGDAALRAEVEALLLADKDASAETFWQHSALQVAALAEGNAASAVGETVGSYRLVALIGRGGMGAVYRAERVDAAFDKCVAVKLIDGFFQSAEVITHFRAERQILAGLEHPNIARLLDGGTRGNGSPYLVMDYIEGKPPLDFCREHALSTAQRVKLFRQICAAVHFAHQHMVIHRDLKPANILVTAEGSPKLLDFGIAKVFQHEPSSAAEELTAPGMQKLTARYASPEQVRGEPVTTATDVYSLGVILYELLTEHSPYGDLERAPHQLMSVVCDDEPARPSTWVRSLKGDLDNIVLKALRKLPGERYASADQFSEDLLRFLDGRPVQAHEDAPLYVVGKFVRRHRVPVAAAGLVLCALVAGLVEVSLARARADRRFNDVRHLAHSVMFDYADAIDQLPGATPVRDRLVKDALVYQDSLAKEADTPELQREVVDGYVRVSDVQGNEYQNNLGDTAAALLSAQKAVDGANALLKRDRSLATLGSAASAFSTSGSLLYSSGDLAGADRAYQRALTLRTELARQSPEDVANQLELASCLRHLGDLYGGYGFASMGKTPEALAYYAQAKALSQQLAARHPTEIKVVKGSYGTLIDSSALENATGKHEEAVQDLGKAEAEIEQVLAQAPHDTNAKVELANVEARIGLMLIDGGQAAAAVAHVSGSLTLLQNLLAADPGNATFRRGEGVVENEFAAALRASGHAADGLEHNQRALRLAQALSQDSPKSLQYRMDVGITQRKLAEGFLATGNAAAALHYAEQASLILCAETPATGKSADATTTANCGRTWRVAGSARLALHDNKSAELALRKAETIASTQVMADPQNVVFRSDAARSQAALAAALAQARDLDAAQKMYVQALANWARLQQSNAMTADDTQRCTEASAALAGLMKVRNIS